MVNKYSFTLPQKNSMSAHKQMPIKRSKLPTNDLTAGELQSNMKSLRSELKQDGGDPNRQAMVINQSPFINKIQDGLHLSSFGNDRTPFFSQYDREQATRDDKIKGKLSMQ